MPGTVGLYDSLYSDTISQEIEEQTNDLLGGSLVNLEFVPIQQQTNGSDCGVFAIAFATCLALGTDPILNKNTSISFRHLFIALMNGMTKESKEPIT